MHEKLMFGLDGGKTRAARLDIGRLLTDAVTCLRNKASPFTQNS